MKYISHSQNTETIRIIYEGDTERDTSCNCLVTHLLNAILNTR